MLEVEIGHRFGGADAFALDIAFAAPPGVTALFGPSGSGKSSVLAAVAGLLRPDRARIAVAGDTLADSANGTWLPAERRRCAVVFQDARLFPHLSVATNLRFGARRAPPGPGPRLDEVVDLLGIAHLLRARPGRLSGGEKQRVALGRALLARPRLLLLDEPLAALDSARRAEILPFLAGIRARFAIPMLYVTHALDEVDRLADTLVLVDAGRTLAHGPLEEMALRTDLPLATRRDAGAVLRGTVLDHDGAGGLTHIAIPGGTLVLPHQPDPPGAPIRIRIRARDVSVATAEPVGLSVGNVLPATVAAVEPRPNGMAMLRLALGDAALLSLVTADAVARLRLAPGTAVWALVKSVTLGASEV